MQTLFENYKSQILLPNISDVEWKNPPIGVRVLCKCTAFFPKEFEAMLAPRVGVRGLRWHIFNVRGRSVCYPHREWRPDSWRSKDA